MSKIFKAGDVVRLRSGGPVMTVSESDQMGLAVVRWFAPDSGELHKTTAPFSILIPATEVPDFVPDDWRTLAETATAILATCLNSHRESPVTHSEIDHWMKRYEKLAKRDA